VRQETNVNIPTNTAKAPNNKYYLYPFSQSNIKWQIRPLLRLEIK